MRIWEFEDGVSVTEEDYDFPISFVTHKGDVRAEIILKSESDAEKCRAMLNAGQNPFAFIWGDDYESHVIKKAERE